MNKEVSKVLNREWGIKRTGSGRYVIIDFSNKNIIDDICGCGCKSYNDAYNYGYSKFHNKGQCNGEPNIDEFNTLI